ncbi:LysR family transcriptional regulator [Thalassotalea nanhaiensis]|uniref:LysR family transcriptional regulator n=1 Tax=Thalassotalea nanhaiensis TaxID=3065648 RepID=A0ABY9TDE2_9GAMM|nr:LysR family transcriptional regulator [Colwelliaceae bacterium SQ345]
MSRNMRNIDLNLLPVFSALMRDKNLSHTAENLGMTQPAVSQALKRLRSLYNDPLFERKGGKMEPTLKAEAIYPGVEVILNDVLHTLPEQDKFDHKTSNKHFHVNILGVAHKLFMTNVIKKLAQIAPNISVTVTSDIVEDIEKSLRDRVYDLHIDYMKGEQTSCHQEAIFSDDLYIMARKDHPRLQGLKEITIEQYMAEFHAAITPRSDNIYPLLKAIKDLPLVREVRYTNSSIRNIIEIVGVTDYLCIMPLGMLASMINYQDYIWFKPPFYTKNMDAYMSWHWAMEHFQSHKWLRSVIIESCKELKRLD